MERNSEGREGGGYSLSFVAIPTKIFVTSVAFDGNMV